jgi:hypothetical protein
MSEVVPQGGLSYQEIERLAVLGMRNGTSQSTGRPPLADNLFLPPRARRHHQTALRAVHGSANGSTARRDAICVLATATAGSCSLRHSGITPARCAYRGLLASGFALPWLIDGPVHGRIRVAGLLAAARLSRVRPTRIGRARLVTLTIHGFPTLLSAILTGHHQARSAKIL